MRTLHVKPKISKESFIAGIIGGIVFTIYFSLVIGNLENLPFYIALCASLLIATIFFSCLYVIKKYSFFRKVGVTKALKNQTGNKTMVLFPVLICLLGFLIYLSEGLPQNTWGINLTDLFWHHSTQYTIVFAILLLMVLYSMPLICHRTNRGDHSKTLFWTIYFLLLAALSAYMIWNPETAAGYSIYHRNAYIYDIYARYYNTPYSASTSGVYGHFGLFYAPVLKILFGICNIQNITTIIACISFVSTLLFCSSMNRITKDQVIRFIAPIAFLITYFFLMKTSLYYQGNPHRFFLSVLYLYVITHDKENTRSFLVRRLAVIFALLWSTDVGIIFYISMTCYELIKELAAKNIRRNIAIVVKRIAIAISDIVLALLLVNIYNLAVGGKLILLNFFYPYNTEYVSGIKEYLAPFPFLYLYFWIIVLYIIVGLFNIIECFIWRKTNNILPVCVCIYGLGSLVYYINRPAYGNMLQTFPSLLTVLILLYERSSGNIRVCKSNGLKLCVHHMTRNIIVMIALAVLCTIPFAVHDLKNEKMKNNPFDNAAIMLKACVPEKTFCAGVGAFETCSSLSWNNLSFHDFIHINYSKEAEKELLEELKNRDSFVIFDYYYDKPLDKKIAELPDLLTNYEMRQSYEQDGVTWKYYCRKYV